MTFDTTSVEVTCVTLPNDHCIQVSWKYIKVCDVMIFIFFFFFFYECFIQFWNSNYVCKHVEVEMKLCWHIDLKKKHAHYGLNICAHESCESTALGKFMKIKCRGILLILIVGCLPFVTLWKLTFNDNLMMPFRTGLGEKVDRLICQRTALSNASIPDSPILFPDERKKKKKKECIVVVVFCFNIFKQLIS